ncbi:hypothetical protein HYY69_02650 [Candidatus Woesearchaeota archaeon]|nr:hypothetical protein [Candidatus Woesearchaeota archaeon]
MHGAIITFKGCEEISKLEIEEILGKKATIKDTIVFFDYENEEELVKLAYLGRSFKCVWQLLLGFTVNASFKATSKVIAEKLASLDLSPYVAGKSFKVECVREGEHDYTSVDIASFVGEKIASQTKAKVSLKTPDVLITVYIYNNTLYLGRDLFGFNLSKRDYKLFHDPDALNAAVAYSLGRFAGVDEGDVILDPLMGTGDILIEAALFLSKKSPHFYKKEKFPSDVLKYDSSFPTTTQFIGYDATVNGLKSSRRNAQIAGINKLLELSRVDLEWLDTKIKESSIDKVITKLPVPSKNIDPAKITKLYNEFFHQVSYVLREDGIMVVCLLKTELFKECIKGFSLIKEINISQGKQELYVLKLKKSKYQ